MLLPNCLAIGFGASFKRLDPGCRQGISTGDIDRGALWFSEIHDQLQDTSVGVVCLTQENKHRPWILFEAGALAKGLSSNRVCTFLIDLKPSDLEDPLSQFNHTLPERDSIWELVRTLNNCLEKSSLDERVLTQVFDTYWPQFESRFAGILTSTPDSVNAEPRKPESMLEEILENTRYLQARVQRLEHRDEVPHFDAHTRIIGAPLTRGEYRALQEEVVQMARDGMPTSAIVKNLVGKGISKMEAHEIAKVGILRNASGHDSRE